MQQLPADIPLIFTDAVRRHQAGQLDEAERLYNKILAMDPDHADGIHLLGLVAHQQGRHDAAVGLLKKAIGVSPKEARYHVSLGLVLKTLGNFDAAIGCYRQAIAFDPELADAHSNLGTALWHQGRLADAESSYRRALTINPDDADVYRNLGVALYHQGKLDEAVSHYGHAVRLNPHDADAHNGLGTALYEQGKLDEASRSYRCAIIQRPNFAGAYNNLANVLWKSGNAEEATTCLHQALAIQPDHAEAHNNLGNAFKVQGYLAKAEISYRRAVNLDPNLTEAHTNLGNVLWEQGDTAGAIASYRHAILFNPTMVEARRNLGDMLYWDGRLAEAADAYQEILNFIPDDLDALGRLAAIATAQGNVALALEMIVQSLRIGETEVNRALFVDIAKHLRFSKDDDELRGLMTRALTEPWSRPLELAGAAANLAKLNPELGACIRRSIQTLPRLLSAEYLFEPPGIAALGADQLLSALLTSTQNTDVELEKFLTNARHALLQAATCRATGFKEADEVQPFFSVLARQCFINEFIFDYTDDEYDEALRLLKSLNAALRDRAPVADICVLAVAAYFPLSTLPFAARLLDRPWPDAIAAVITQQLREPAEEKQLGAAISSATVIENKISRSVRDQYEEHPYPRWVSAAPVAKKTAIATYLRQRFPLAPFYRIEKAGPSEIFIAGCGTGQHSVEVAQRTTGRVLAVDLSLSSLAYALRKTREIGLAGITYTQADILELGYLGPSFDVIECAGVLHHMPEPFGGWGALLSLLRPGGFMMVGIYSKAARRNVVKARRYIEERGYRATASDIRRCRQDLLNLGKDDRTEVVGSADFFCISGCRDLLFNVCESQTELTEIDTFIRRNNLRFLGFEIEVGVLHTYRQHFPDDPAALNLNNWHLFENSFPDMFSDMYNFWIQKAY